MTVTVVTSLCALTCASTACCSWIIIIHPLILTALWRPGSKSPLILPRPLCKGRERSLRDVQLPTQSCPALITGHTPDLPI